MKYNDRYSIGDMSRICNVSTKALRFYDRIGLISSQRHGYNNYRYYNGESLLVVPVIKYYKQMGFTLEEMRTFIDGCGSDVFRLVQKAFLSKIREHEQEQLAIHRRYVSVKDWYDLVQEAEMILDNNIREVSVKYVEPEDMIFQEQDFDTDLRAAIINIDWVNYLDEIHNEITGAVNLNFLSYRDRMNNKEQRIRIMQKPLLPSKDLDKIRVGGSVMAACYHIGPHESLPDTYKKICDWTEKHGYTLGEESFERYLTDYWLTRDSDLFVTEVMIPVSRRRAA